jgi:type II restriction enzyme
LYGDTISVKLTNVDLYLEDTSGTIWLFDIKTAKPNIGNFQGFKQTLLEWAGAVMFERSQVEIQTMIAIPYNPYAPEPYKRWTIKGILDLPQELMVAEEFWDFLGGEGCYNELLDCFERVGIRMRDELDTYFRRFN